MTWYNCTGISEWVCMLKGAGGICIVFLIGAGLDGLVNIKKHKNERDLKKIENKKIKEILERENE